MLLRIERLGETAVLLAVDGAAAMETQRHIWSLAAAARSWTGVEEAVVGMNNLTLFVDLPHRVLEIEARLRRAWPRSTPDPSIANTVEIPVQYGDASGPDLPDIARRCNCTEEDVISLHCGREYEVYFLGFQPGFAYMGDLDSRLRLPRRAQPRTSIPAGSVVIAEHMTGIHPARSPGGWHVIGRTDLPLFTFERNPPSRLSPGDRVRFVRACNG